MSVNEFGDESRYKATSPSGDDERSAYEKDLDRLRYSYYFKRLAEITQVSSYSGGEAASNIDRPLLHNRMTHSIKVGQVGRRIAQRLMVDETSASGLTRTRGVYPDVAEFAGLAHDIGHPPFGHIGEQVLDEFARANGLVDGFEGNAQTFRILTHLTRHLPSGSTDLVRGLNVTARSLASCVKYPWPRGAAEKEWRKFGFYAEDHPVYDNFVAKIMPEPPGRTIEAQIMDWADDITYAVHDLEDFALSGDVPLVLLKHTCKNMSAPVSQREFEPTNVGEWSRFWDYVQRRRADQGDQIDSTEARRKFGSYSTLFPETSDGSSSFGNASIVRLCSNLIEDAILATHVDDSGDLEIDNEMDTVVDIFKQLTWYYVIERHELVSVQAGQSRRLRRLCNELLDLSRKTFELQRPQPWDTTKLTFRSSAEILSEARRLPPRLANLIAESLREGRILAKPHNLRDATIVRCVVDYVASLREREIRELHERYLGMTGVF